MKGYIDAIGAPPFASDEFEEEHPDPSGKLIRHRFILSIWPHLYWRVCVSKEGFTSDLAFENQVKLRPADVDPSRVRPSIWTISPIESAADEAAIEDGWGEHTVMHYRFGTCWYRGEFIFGLLQE